MTIAVTGATGQLGRLVIDSLKSRIPTDRIVALVRSPAKAADLGVETRAFDYSEPGTLAPALKGIDSLLLISSNEVGHRAPQHLNVIQAAEKAGVRHILYTSLLHADTSPLALAVEHRATETALTASPLVATILRNGWYTENYTGSLPVALEKGALIGSAGDGRISSATRADYAEAAAAILTGEGHEGKVYELAGDTSYTLADLAAELSRQSGKTIPYINLSEAEYAAALVQAGLPEGFASLLANSDKGASAGGLFDDSRTLSALIGRATTPLSEAVKQALA